MTRRRLPLLLIVTLLLPLLVSACGSQTGQNGDHAYRLAPLSQMPDVVQEAPAAVREAYRFAVYNQDTLSRLPCYCGCGAMGHTSNYSCYVQSGEGADVILDGHALGSNYSCYVQEGAETGDIVYDTHALGCSICVDITQDAMRMLDEGKSAGEIVEYVDATYSRFGPPTPLQQTSD